MLVLPVKTTTRICVLSSTGNAGKTTASAYFLAPRMENTLFMAAETLNQNAKDWGFADVLTFTGDQFGEMITEMLMEDDRPVLADIGASNIERFYTAMGNYANAVSEFQIWCIPVNSDKKSIEEAARTVVQLNELGVSPHQIVVLPNRVKTNFPEEEFGPLFTYVQDNKNALIDPAVYLPESQVFSDLMQAQLSMESLLDGTDYRALSKEARRNGNNDEAYDYARKYVLCQQAASLKAHLDEAFRKMWSMIHV